MEALPLLIILLLFAATLFGKLYFMSRLPAEKEEDGNTVPSCSHKKNPAPLLRKPGHWC